MNKFSPTSPPSLCFDIIIPTHNRSSFLSKAINSVLEQEFSHWNLFIIDDGSTDDTHLLCQKFLQKDHRIHYYYQENQGVSSARNMGINLGSAPWICFLDSDDRWFKNKLTVFANYLQHSPQTNLLHSDEIWIRRGVRVNQMKKHQKGGGDQFKRSLKMCLISPSACCLKRSFLDKIIFKEEFIFDPNFLVCEDYDLWLRILAFNLIDYIDQPLVEKYGGHDDQLSQRFIAMDYERIKSMARLYPHIQLEEQKRWIEEEIQKKLILLEKGAKKHQNQSLLEKIKDLYLHVFTNELTSSLNGKSLK